MPCREIFYGIAACVALFGAHGDDEGDFHLIRLAELIADPLAGEVDRYRHILSAEILREFYRVSRRIFFDDADHELGWRRVFGHQIVAFEKMARRYVTHTKSDRRNFLAASARGGSASGGKLPNKRVIAAAAKERTAVVFVCVEDFKDHAGVVVEAARDLGVHAHVAHTHVFELAA